MSVIVKLVYCASSTNKSGSVAEDLHAAVMVLSRHMLNSSASGLN